MKHFCWGWIVLTLLGLAGCTQDTTVKLTGQVTLDGQPLELGEIRFTPADGKGQPTGSAIKGGKYETSLPCGSMNVLITAFKVGKERPLYEGMPNSPTAPTMTQVAEEKLTCEITGPGIKDFDVKTKTGR